MAGRLPVRLRQRRGADQPDFHAYVAASFLAGRPVLAAALDLTRRLHADFRYDLAATTVATPVRDVLAARPWVCQDFAHVQMAYLRRWVWRPDT